MISKSPSNDNTGHEPVADPGHVLMLPGLTVTGLADVAALLARYAVAGDVIYLRGPLGAGKTTFTQAFCRACGVTEAVTSPTFTLIHEYQGVFPVWHIDAYRLSELSPEDVESRLMPIEEALAQKKAIFLIEWPDELPEPRPNPTWELSLAYDANDDSARVLAIHLAPEALAQALSGGESE